MYNINDKSAAVAEVQKYLREIMRMKGLSPLIASDGIYDEITRDAVRSFQKDNSLDVTGVVDERSFLLLYNEYLAALDLLASPRCLSVLGDKLDADAIQAGEESSNVAIIQALLKNLKVIYEDIGDIEINGVFDRTTEDAVRSVQRIYSLEENGVIDRKTWNALVSEYEKFINADT